MDAYIGEKLVEIKTHAKRLYTEEYEEGGEITEQRREQEYRWILRAVDSIKTRVEHIEIEVKKRLEALEEIKETIEQGGELAFIVKSIGTAIRKAEKI